MFTVFEERSTKTNKESITIRGTLDSTPNRSFTVQLFSNPKGTNEGQTFLEHLDMITKWEEFETFFGTVEPIDVRVYGQLSPEAEAWVRQFDVTSHTFQEHVAGFVR